MQAKDAKVIFCLFFAIHYVIFNLFVLHLFGGSLSMKKIAIVADSNAGITQKEADEMGVYVVPMPFIVDGEEYFEDISLTQAEFFEKLADDAQISTSQPAIAQVTELWDRLLKEYDQVVHIPMSSGLSESMNTARNFAENNYKYKVFVVDNHRISITQKSSVQDALNLAKEGYDGQQIKEYLERTGMDASIYIMVNTLKYLKKGGRITPAAAAIGTVLNIKPVLQIQGGKLDQFAKVLNVKAAKLKMIEAIKHDLQTRFKELAEKGEMKVAVAHTNNQEKAIEFAKELEAATGIVPVYIDPLSLSVACHIGSGALACGCFRVYKKEN